MVEWTNDLVENKRRREAAEAAARGPLPPPIASSPTNGHGVTDPVAYARGALRREADALRTATCRNNTLNTAAFKMRGYITGGYIDEATVIEELFAAGRAADTDPSDPFTDQEIRDTLRSAFTGSDLKVGARVLPKRAADAISALTLDTSAPVGTRGNRINLLTLDEITSAAPTWAWEYNGHGRIQRGTLCLLAGRPGAGKSNAARWFAAGFTNGTMAGCFFGKPVHVAYISPAEESHAYVIKPGLIAAGAVPSRIHFPQVLDTAGKPTERLQSQQHEQELTQLLRDTGIRVVIVDPVMSTIPGGADINRNNETRAYVEPWARIAGNIDGIVLGIAHLVKHPGVDLVAAINGSSAFGEVARSIFGFVKDRASGDRVMSQVKNSAGFEDLSLTYAIAPTEVPVDSGEIAEVAVFAITGVSDLTAADVLNGDLDPVIRIGPRDEARMWVSDYLESMGRSRANDVLKESKVAGHAPATVYRAAKRLRVVVDYEGFPRCSYWRLPDSWLRETATGAGGG